MTEKMMKVKLPGKMTKYHTYTPQKRLNSMLQVHLEGILLTISDLYFLPKFP